MVTLKVNPVNNMMHGRDFGRAAYSAFITVTPFYEFARYAPPMPALWSCSTFPAWIFVADSVSESLYGGFA
jgi:hypothetical protein